MKWLKKISIKIQVWSPDQGYDMNNQYLRSIAPFMNQIDLSGMEDGATVILREYEITKGTDEYGRPVITHIERIRER